MSIRYTADQLQRKFPGAPGAPGFPRLAEGLRVEGKCDEAIQVCQDGLRVRPNTLSAYLVLGKALLDTGRIEEARDQFEAALRLDARCLSAMHFLAGIMTRMQWAEAAAGYYRSILELEPWDAEIRALLGEAAPAGERPSAFSVSGSAPGLTAAGISSPAHAPEEDTFRKPEGFAGDVMEVSLNDMAADFLPGQANAELGLPEESLEDALAEPRETVPDAFKPSEEARRAAIPDAMSEPRPLDVFKEDAPAPMETMAEDGPPISGQDVEDRLDSLFGIEDAPSASVRSSSATWSPAPAESPDPEIPAADTGEIPVRSGDDFPGSQTALHTGSLSEPGPFDLGAVPDLPKADAAEAISVGDYSAVDFVTPSQLPQPAGTDAEGEEGGRVQGEDIERRLDELFNLVEEDDRYPATASASAPLPVAPDPKVEEAVAMGETVSFGGALAFRETEAPAFSLAIDEAQAVEADPAAAKGEAPITGQDVADKMDNLFGTEAAAAEEPPARETAAAPSAGNEAAEAEGSDVAPVQEMKPWQQDEAEPEPPAGDVMSTESMLPPGWFGQAGDGPSITGADVEDQLDKLFHLDEDGEPGKPSAPAPAAPGKTPAYNGDTSAFTAPSARDLETAFGDKSRPMPGDESDMTVMMPAMTDPVPEPAADVRLPKDGGRIKESVADWLARQNEEADQRTADAKASGFRPMADANETLILPSGDVERGGDAALEGEDADAFGALAPEEMAALSDTTSIEMVDGVDVAERLDELFADEGSAATAAGRGQAAPQETEMPLFSGDAEETLDLQPQADLGEDLVSGEDVSARMDDMFATGAPKAADPPDGAPSGSAVPGVSDTDEELLPMTDSPKAAAQPAPELAPMMDEEEGYPEEEEMSSGTGAAANVATVTLAEIYFQQGLREQALQIYRQLLEREPENESVRKRIEEIEAIKPEGGDRGPGTDPRRPRPGLKVPKRKK